MIRRRPRRGLVLMLVLTLLTLFALMAVTFVIVTGLYEDSSKAHAKIELRGDPPEKLMERVLYDLVRDTNDQRSPIRLHSLLMDMYGVDFRIGTLHNQRALPDTGNQFIECEIKSFADGGRPFDQVRGYYEGCVLTFGNGPAKGLSTRIVYYDYNSNSGSYIIRFLAPKNNQGITLTTSTPVVPPPPAAANKEVTFLINGRPFNGTGAGYNQNTDMLDARTSPGAEPIALWPNTAQNLNSNLYSGVNVGGDLDESYDAADYQNMILAALLPNPMNENQIGFVVPSFHRQALVNYFHQKWIDPNNMWPGDVNVIAQMRRFVLRPLPTDHPEFTGSNPNPAMWHPGGSWDQMKLENLLNALASNRVCDVDNDGDGVADSIWLDLGYPPVTDPSGRTYKPLFAVLCTDLDGRLNVNAHGNLWHTAGQAGGFGNEPNQQSLAQGALTSNLPGGPGLGPPAITLAALGINGSQYNNLLQARYGADNRPGYGFTLDPLSGYRFLDIPGNYFSNPIYSAYQSPPDLRDRLAFGLDHYGQPIYERDPENTDLRIDVDYELDHSPDAPRGTSLGKDMLYTYAELERLLRAYDVDTATLPERLIPLMQVASVGAANRNIVTTDSYDLPVPYVRYTRDMLDNLKGSSTTTAPNPVRNRAYHFLDLLRFRLQNETSPPEVPPLDIDNEIAKMVPFDLRRGLRWDVNMPFGNGADNNGNGLADEHGIPGLPSGSTFEANQYETIPPIAGIVPDLNSSVSPAPTPPLPPGVPFDFTNQLHVTSATTPISGSATNGNDRMLTRHLYARYLYVLMMTLTDPNAFIPQFEIRTTPPNTTDQEERARGFAQWAINVVDFRDADSINTPFEYDLNPFNGWNVDGIVTGSPEAESRVVWGCERPELLLTETIALHDRRTEDLDNEIVGMGQTAARTDDMNNPDPDFDQRLRPRGSLFIELFNPWASPSLKVPNELYQSTVGVKLDASAPNGTPVWRILVVDGDGATQRLDPDDPDTTLRPNSNIERGIYFTNPSVLSGNQHGRMKYWSTQGVAPVAPGKYAVIGGYHYRTPAGDYVSTMGRRSLTTDANADDVGELNNTRRIVIHPDANPTNSYASVPAPNTYPGEPGSNDYQTPVGIVIDAPVGISVSEPLGGYAAYDASNPPPAGSTWEGPSTNQRDGQYGDGSGSEIAAPIDVPLDKNRANNNADWEPLLNDGTTPRFRTVHLQRLANPGEDWHALRNPYLTIDSASVDLIAFNGIAPDEGKDTRISNGDMVVSTHQRGENINVTTPRMLWRHEPPRAAFGADDTVAGTNHVFDYALTHSLGYLNEKYRPLIDMASAAGYPHPYNGNTTHYLGAPNTQAGPAFPWLTWNNRPFNNNLEMMLVPFARSSRLMYGYSFIQGGSPYNPTNTGQFDHLLNFYESGVAPNQAANMYRLFEFTHVPSKFISSDTVLNTGWFTKFVNNQPNTNHMDNGRGTNQFHPPYNKFSNYRDPGRVNVNTIYSDRVWQALFVDGFGPNGYSLPSFAQWIDSRRGYVGSGPIANQAQFSNATPTLFSNPYRGGSAGRLVPLQSLVRADVDTTLLRSDTVAAVANPNGVPFFDVNSTSAENNSERNPYFRAQSVQRLSNLVTSRSNVYAIWITVGYFEIDPTTQQLGREVGSDSGEIKRHRSFYIVDRSIPVAFEPGQNHNVDKAIRLRRFIE